MSARPGEWYLLTDDGNDPVPGDPDAVSREQKYYADMAQTIMDEAHRLADLGHSSNLVGKYSQALEKDLADLADEVHKAHRRYDQVGQALAPYVTALYNARDESAAALRDAVTAHAHQQSAASSPNPQAEPGKKLTAAQKTQQTQHGNAVQAADDELGRAKTRLANALSDLNDAGKKAGGLISDGSQDSLKDHHHWWDVVVDIVKIIVKVAGYVAMAAAIVMLFIPGLDLLDVALMATWVAFGGDALLFATGNGSLLDLAIDAVGLVTLGFGGAAASAGKLAVKDTAAATTRYVERNAKTIITDAGSLGRKALRTQARTYASSLFHETTGIANPIRSLRYAGDPELADAADNVQRAMHEFPRSTTIRAGYDATNRALRTARLNFGINSVLTGGNTVANDAVPPWVDYKDTHLNYFKGGPLSVGE